MLRKKESIQGIERKSQHLPQVSKIILFVLNVFQPTGSFACAHFRERWVCCSMYSMTTWLLIHPQGKGGWQSTVHVKRHLVLAASSLSHSILSAAVGSSHFRAIKLTRANGYNNHFRQSLAPPSFSLPSLWVCKYLSCPRLLLAQRHQKKVLLSLCLHIWLWASES